MRQTARRLRDDKLIATAEFVFVCIDRTGKPVPVPEDVGRFMNARATLSAGSDRLTVNGVNLAVDIKGEGPAILFVHGYPLDRTIWRHQVAGLTGFKRIAPDLRGMGLSDAPDLGYSMATYADDLAALLDTLGIDQAAVCGLSMGGYVAFEFIRRWRSRVRALILIDSRAEADGVDGRRAREAAIAQVREQGAAAIAEAMLPKMLSPETHASRPDLVEEVRSLMVATPVPGIVGALSAMRDRVDSTPLLATLAPLPVLIVVGEDDQLTPPSMAHNMAKAVPGGRLEIIPKAGHLPTIERAEETTRILADFLSSLG